MSEQFLVFLDFDEAKHLMFDRLMANSIGIKAHAKDLESLGENPTKTEVENVASELDETISRLISIRTTLDQMAQHAVNPLSNNKIFAMNK